MERAEHRPRQKEYIPKPLDPAVAERKRQLAQPPSPEEIARRKKVLAKFERMWAATPFLETDPSEFLQASREEDEAGY